MKDYKRSVEPPLHSVDSASTIFGITSLTSDLIARSVRNGLMKGVYSHSSTCVHPMARSIRSKRLQRNRSVRRSKFYEREKQKLWELAKKVSDREKVETAKERNGTSDASVQEDGECSVVNCVHRGSQCGVYSNSACL